MNNNTPRLAICSNSGQSTAYMTPTGPQEYHYDTEEILPTLIPGISYVNYDMGGHRNSLSKNLRKSPTDSNGHPAIFMKQYKHNGPWYSIGIIGWAEFDDTNIVRLYLNNVQKIKQGRNKAMAMRNMGYERVTKAEVSRNVLVGDYGQGWNLIKRIM
tara:strand:+ start:3682 stop:4152 length:471 start_codon:yes stop_codon:yes gene_type:complete